MENRRLKSNLLLISFLALGTTLLGSVASAQFYDDDFETGDFSNWPVVSPAVPTVFRFSDLDLRDPHMRTDLPLVGCADFTDQPQLGGLVPAFNATVEQQLTTDADGDGNLDASILLLFRPLNTQGSGRLDTRNGICTDPLTSTSCMPDPLSMPQVGDFQSQATGVCLEALPGTTSGYTPGITEPQGPCFVSTAVTLSLGLGGLEIPLQDGQIAASYLGSPAIALDSGLLRGFLTEAAATVLIPPDVPQVGGQPISSLFPGGVGNCIAPPGDLDMHNGESGWWFYLNFDADQVQYIGP